MMRTLLLVTALIFAGCVEPADRNVQPTALPETSAAAPANATQEIMAPVVTVATDATVTRSEAVTLFVNTTGAVDIVVKLDGAETLREAITASVQRTVPVGFGLNLIDVVVSSPGHEETVPLSVVRLGKTTMNIDYGVFHPASQGAPRVDTFEVWIDIDARPSAPAYTDQGISHFDAFTAHDQLVVFEQVTGKKVVFEYFPSFQGYAVSRIDGAGGAISSDAPPWWCYTVNAASPDGISIQRILPGDVVAWDLGGCA